MHNERYSRYIKSARWRRKRCRALKRAGNRCEYMDSAGKRCTAQTRLHTHHLTYKHFGKEPGEDLQILCEKHHAVAELLKLQCPGCALVVFTTIEAALAAWARARNRWPKDWTKAVSSAKELYKLCDRCKNRVIQNGNDRGSDF